MEVKILIRDVRIYFESKIPSNIQLSLKVAASANISKTNRLTWNRFCKRWENSKEIISLDIYNIQELKIQILKHKDSSVFKPVFQGKIQLETLPQSLNEELKICLSTNGKVMGWLYCELQRGQNPIQKQQHFLNIHRLTTTFLDMRDQDCSMSIYLNNSLIFIKEIHLKLRKRALFPNIKQVVKKSDLLVFEIDSKRQKGRYSIFLVDFLQSGKTALLKAWIRNKIGNKMGQFEIEYFLQNFYLPNSNPQFSDKQIQPTKIIRVEEALTKKEREDLRLEVNIQSLTNIQSINFQMNKNTLLRRVILGQRRRRNLIYIADNGNKVKKRTSLQMDEILQDNSIVDM